MRHLSPFDVCSFGTKCEHIYTHFSLNFLGICSDLFRIRGTFFGNSDEALLFCCEIQSQSCKSLSASNVVVGKSDQKNNHIKV